MMYDMALPGENEAQEQLEEAIKEINIKSGVIDETRELDDFEPPKYFQDIFEKFNLADEGFVLKDVLVDPEVKKKFLNRI